MFIIFNKDKILSYLISISTVAILFVMSFAITKNNNEILKTSTNVIQNEANANQTSVNQVDNIQTNSNIINNKVENSIENHVNSTSNAVID